MRRESEPRSGEFGPRAQTSVSRSSWLRYTQRLIELGALSIAVGAARPSASASFDAPPHRKSGRLAFPLRRAFLQGCGERRIAGSAVDEFGWGAERDHHAPGRIANRVLAIGAYLERAFRFGCAVDPANRGGEKDPLRATRQSRPGRTCPPAADRPSRRRAAGRAARNPPRNRPRSRPAGRGSWAHICPRLPASRVPARAAAGVVRPAELEQAEAPGRRRAEPRASWGAARATARRLAVLHQAPG